ncbi:MAG TPA: glycosyltransferase [Acidimicrobiales bacterium]|nr:glycosyltransferase [Acidimicrobiales bacterium]
MTSGKRGAGKKPSGRVTAGRNRGSLPGSLLWLAPFFNHSGYGEEARGFVRSLDRDGVPIAIRSSGDDSSSFVDLLRDTPDLAKTLSRLLGRKTTPPVTTVIHLPGSAMHRPGGSSLVIGRTMFETDGLPPGWPERINLLDEVWVPASFNVETFKAAGVHTPTFVVPGGVDAALFRPDLKPLEVPGRRGVTFLAVFEWSHRKAPDVLLKAWAQAFGPDDDVSLVLRCFTRSKFAGDSTQGVEALIEQELNEAGYDRAAVAPIIVWGRQLSAPDMPRLMAAADVFVGVSRGEGWGRPLLEGMACGLPVIGTRWGGNTEFMDDGNSLLVDIEGLVEVDDRMDAAFYRGQRWAQPSVDHLAELLRRAATDEALRRQLGKAARRDVEQRWQWRHAARSAALRLAEITGDTRKSTRAASGQSSGADPSVRLSKERIRWCGDIYSDHGLANVNRELVARLSLDPALGLEAVTTEVPPFPRENMSILAGVPGAGLGRGSGPISVEVRHFWPADLSAPMQGKLVVILPWEYGGVPAEWIPALHNDVDEIWVPTSWVRDGYIRSGIPADKVAVIPNGVDVDTFTPDGPRLTFAKTHSRRLLFVGGAIYRKGFDLLLDAYREEFGPNDDVCLVVKPFGFDGVYSRSSMGRKLLDAASDPLGPAIEIIDRHLSRDELAMLYRSCDVLVHPYRGEGFGLPVAEAMACGIPVIVTGSGACLDFCDDTTGWLVEATEIPGTLVDWTPGPAGFWWADPDRDHLRHLMRRAVEDDGARRTRGAAARRRIAEGFTWDIATGRAAGRLRAVMGIPPTMARIAADSVQLSESA